jgi:hypothetical protein
MLSKELLTAMVWLHCLGDFFFQTDFMAKGKSKSNWILSYHIAIYTLPMLLLGWRFALVNALVHWGIDWVTSRMTSRLWAEGNVRVFFIVIGVDQALHYTVLIWTAALCR